MPVETANYISDLVPTNPQLGDNIADGPNHFWLIKKAIQNTFPNIKGVITASQDQLNTLTGLVGSSTSDGLDLKGSLTVSDGVDLKGSLTVSNGVDIKGSLTVGGETLVPSVTDWTQKQAVPASDADSRYMKLTDAPFVDAKLRFQVIQTTVGPRKTVYWPKAFASEPVFVAITVVEAMYEYPHFVYCFWKDAKFGVFQVESFPPDSSYDNIGSKAEFTSYPVCILVGGYF